ncbi:hypothetical protein [Erythrobacter tepidarius]|uniref:hypothetical protein n=1 Tax=Erythrobacter tepidarius TaxID=60454 RepID=UPI000A3CF9A5|nr:hypothetical protein [Erythrobacter tepidarius]
MHTITKIATPAMLLLLAACGGADPQAPAATDAAPVEQAAAVPGDGDSQGDAKVAGTNYNATAQISCAGYKGAAAGMCDAGVIRNGADGTTVEVTLPDATKRAIFFNPDGSFLSFSTAEADGTAAMAISSEKKGDVTIARLGTETYEIPDAFVLGD